MSEQVEASIEIDAPVEAVWATVHDPAVYVDPPRRAVHSHASGELEADLEVQRDFEQMILPNYKRIVERRLLPDASRPTPAA